MISSTLILVVLIIFDIMCIICIIKPIYDFVFIHKEWKIWKTILNNVDSFKEIAKYPTASLYKSENSHDISIYIWDDGSAGVFNEKMEMLAVSFVSISSKVIKKLK